MHPHSLAAPLPWPADRHWRALAAAAALLICAGFWLSGGSVNMALFAGINGAAGPWQDRLAIQLTLLGVGYPVMILLLAADPRGGLGPALALRTLIVAALLARALKPLLAYPRPLGVLDPHLVHVAGSPVAASNALPSGHTLTALLARWPCGGFGAARAPACKTRAPPPGACWGCWWLRWEWPGRASPSARTGRPT